MHLHDANTRVNRSAGRADRRRPSQRGSRTGDGHLGWPASERAAASRVQTTLTTPRSAAASASVVPYPTPKFTSRKTKFGSGDISPTQLQPSEVANIGRLARGEPLHNVVHGG